MGGMTQFGITLDARTTGEEQLRKMEDILRRVTGAAQGASTASDKAHSAVSQSASGMATSIRDGFRDPVSAASSAFDGFLGKLSGGAAIMAGTAAGMAAVGVATFSLAKSYGSLYEQQANNAERLGVSINDYALLSQASSEAGLSGDALVSTMRTMSKALDENSKEGKDAREAMARYGIATKDAHGNALPMMEQLLQIADRLGEISNPAERARIAIELMGRPALEVLPLMNSGLRAQVKELEAAGVGWTEYQQLVGAASDKMADRFDRFVAEAIRKTKELAASLFIGDSDLNPIVANLPGNKFRGMLSQEEVMSGALGVTLSRIGVGGSANAFATIAKDQKASDKAYIEAQNRGDLERRLSDAQKELAETEAKSDRIAYDRLKGEIKSLKASIEAARKAKSDVETANAFVRDVYAVESSTESPYLKKSFELLEKMGNLKLSPDQTRDALASMWRISLNEEADERKKLTKEWEDLQLKANKDVVSSFKEQWDEVYKLANDRASRVASAAVEMGKAGIEYQYSGARGTAQGAYSLSQSYASTLNLTPGASANLTEQMRVSLAKELRDIELEHIDALVKFYPEEIQNLKRQELQIKARGDYEKEIDDARLDRERAYFEYVRDNREKLRETAGSIFDAITASGGGLRDYATGFAKGLGRTMFQNMYVEMFQGMSGKLTIPGQTGANGELTMLGKLLKGTPFAKNDLQPAAIQLTAAQMQQQAAGTMMAAASTIAGGGTAGAGGGFSLLSATLGAGGKDYKALAMSGMGLLPGETLEGGTTTAGRSTMSKMAGIAGLAASGYGIYSGISQGGARGALTAAGSAGGALASLSMLSSSMSVLGPVGAILGFASTVAVSLFGDPKVQKAKALAEEADARKYEETSGITYTSTSRGQTAGLNYVGGVNITINALDASSILDRADDIAAAVVSSMTNNPDTAAAFA